MRRTIPMLFSAVALCGWMGAAAFADVDSHKADAQKDINEGKRKAADDEMKALKESTGNHEMTSLDKELRDKLGDSWTVRKSGNGFLATRVSPKKAPSEFDKKVGERMRDFRDTYKEAQVTHARDEVMLRGRIDDCGDAARAADKFASVDGVNRIEIDLACAGNL